MGTPRGQAQGDSGDPLWVSLESPTTSHPSTELVCNRTFDKFSCWPDALPNTTINVSCPWFLPWYQKGEGRAWGRARHVGQGAQLCAWCSCAVHAAPDTSPGPARGARPRLGARSSPVSPLSAQ